MKLTVRIIIVMIALLGTFPAGMKAEMNPGDTLKVSLITCSPGQEIYEYYGHTALRVQDLTSGDDVTFNFGMFSFNTPNFVWRFVCGKTDYMLGAVPTAQFLPEYAERGSYVQADVLNLTQEECHRLLQSLVQKCLQGDWTYHYDFFYDNCATRVRDEIMMCLRGHSLQWAVPETRQPLRGIVHEFSKNYEWSLFGQDLLIGSEADKPATRLAQQFAPTIMELDLRTAILMDSAGAKRLVTDQEMLVEARDVPLEKGFPLSPLTCCLILLALTMVCTVVDFWRGKVTWLFDAVLLSLQGLVGLLVTFMFFFSQHPTVDSNWLVLLFNPLPLVFLWWTLKAERNMQPSRYHWIARFWIFAFIVLVALKVIPQFIGNEVLALAFCLLLRSVSYCSLLRRIDRKKETA